MLTVEGLRKRYRGHHPDPDWIEAVAGVSLFVERGKLLTLLGPSGCGKTTVLRCIAGLEQPDEGEIDLDARVIFSSNRGISMPVGERRMGMVFQSYAVWPHMSVFENVAFPLRAQRRSVRLSSSEVRKRVETAIGTVRLGGLGSRRVTQLSGGQQQRVALARALVMEPSLLLLDEPLSNLDAKLREEMRLEIKRLQRDLGLTAIYVTHDQMEALTISNTVAVMNDGRIDQEGKPREIYERPSSSFIADFIGSANLVPCRVLARAEGRSFRVVTPHGHATASASGDLQPGDQALLVIRPEQITAAPAEKDAGAEWRGHVVARAFRGDAVDHVIELRGSEIRVRCEANLSIPPGTEVSLEPSPAGCWLIGDHG